MNDIYNRSVEIDDVILHVFDSHSSYVVVFLENYLSRNIVEKLDYITSDILMPEYQNRMKFSNVCGSNSEIACKILKGKYDNDKQRVGKIFMHKFKKNNYVDVDENINKLEKLFGSQALVIGASYHALVYIELQDDVTGTFYIIAIDSVCNYQIQYYVSPTEEGFKKLIKARYLCEDFKITWDCNDWDIYDLDLKT